MQCGQHLGVILGCLSLLDLPISRHDLLFRWKVFQRVQNGACVGLGAAQGIQGFLADLAAARGVPLDCALIDAGFFGLIFCKRQVVTCRTMSRGCARYAPRRLRTQGLIRLFPACREARPLRRRQD